MRRKFRQKADQKPKDDPLPSQERSDDGAEENVDIDDVIQEIDKHLADAEQEHPSPGAS